MQSARDEFRLNMSRVRNLGAIYKALKVQTTQVIDLDDILRAELVLAVSTFDRFVHEIVRLGMLDMYQGNRPQTDAFKRFTVKLGNVLLGIEDPQQIDWLDQSIRDQHKLQSFQSVENVAGAIRLISNVRLWERITQHLGRGIQQQYVKEVKDTMSLIVDRRNKIAHEADTYSRSPGGRWTIDEEMVDDSVDFLEQVAEAIFTIIH